MTNSMGLPNYIKYKKVNNGSDLNSLSGSNCYYGVNTGSYLNIPFEKDHWVLFTFKFTAQWTTEIQLIIGYENRPFIRRKWNETTWSEWYTL